jgi:hypothetical protein
MYPDRTYGPKFNNAVNRDAKDVRNPTSALAPKKVHKPINFGNMQSLSYWKPTIVTRDYQREMPPNLVATSTLAVQNDPRKEELKRAKSTTYGANYCMPNKKLAANITQKEGIKLITQDLKTLGFRKKPHEATCRQKSYDLSKTALFSSSFNGASQDKFFSSFDKGYFNHTSNISQHNKMGLRKVDHYTPKSTLEMSTKAAQAIRDREKYSSMMTNKSGGAILATTGMNNPAPNRFNKVNVP